MKFAIKGNISHHDVQTMAQVFFHNMPFELVEEEPAEGSCLVVQRDEDRILAQLRPFSHTAVIDGPVSYAVKLAIYNVLVKFTGYRPPWGLLTGIRPCKIALKLLDSGAHEQEAVRALIEQYLTNESKARLCVKTALRGAGVPANGVGLYVSIPFCPSICRYCSFSSYPMAKFGKLAEDYIDALVKEIAQIGRRLDGRVENIYIGGGTPTALNERQLERLLTAIAENFDTKSVLEYTVEAGRPDTINTSKLGIIRDFGATRICINPQTLNDSTLERIGRGHSAADFFAAYEAARAFGFQNINIDLILGLPGETALDAERTMRGIAALNPNAVTVHALAIKRASGLHRDLEQTKEINSDQMELMIEISAKYMEQAGLEPYYLYRQKNSPGNFENVGYARPGFEGRYNIQMMEERQSIYGAGAGAVTKLVEGDKIRRVFNQRQPWDYIDN